MSATLPSADSADTLPIVEPSSDFISQLIREQQNLSAVETFSHWHSNHSGEHESNAPVQEKYYRSLLPATPPGPDQQLAFEVDLDACSGCKACVVACHTMNGLEEDESWRRVGTLLIGDPEFADSAAIQHVTTACHHCEDPGCLNGCPVKAYDKDPDTGIVRHLDDQCIGCKYCTMMCPYEVPQYSKRLGIVRKCDMCHQRLSVGEAPACVQSCPNEAIRIRIVPGESAQVTGDDRLVPSAPRSQITLPTTRYVTSNRLDDAVARPQDQNVDHLAESHWPLAVMLVATQISVGILVCEAIASLTLSLASIEVPEGLSLAVWVTAFLIGNLGLGIAPLHLGQPLRMWRVFLGLKTSWLSREAVVLGQFMGLLAFGIAFASLPFVWDWIPAMIRDWIPTAMIPQWAGRALVTASIPVGIAGLYCSAMIYVATQRSQWRFERTIPRFLATGLILGSIIAAAAFAFFGFGIVAALLALVSAATGIWKWNTERTLYSGDHPSLDSYDLRGRRLVHDHLSETLRMRSFCSIVAVAFSILSVALCPFLPLAGCLVALSAAFVGLIGENLERLLYFQSVVHDRMPGTL